VRTMSAMVCASAAVALGPRQPRAAPGTGPPASGFTPNTVYPAAGQRRHPQAPVRSRSQPAPRPSQRPSPRLLADHRVQPGRSPPRPRASRARGQRPAALIHQLDIVMILSPVITCPATVCMRSPVLDASTSTASPRENHQRPNKPVAHAAQPAGTTSQQRSTLPATGRGTICLQGSRRVARGRAVLTRRRLPDPSLPGWPGSLTLIRDGFR